MKVRADPPAGRSRVLAAALLALACDGGGTGAPVVEVVVLPEEALIVGEGRGQRFEAIAYDAAGGTGNAAADWSVDRPRVATISSRGFTTGRSNGVTTVTATIGGVGATAHLEVYVPPVITDYEPGRRYFGRRDYTEYVPGELPLLASTHGGRLVPDEIPDRDYGVVRNDLNSLELTLALRQALIDLTGQAPHVVLSHLHRGKLDANREIEEAAQDNPYAEQAWREFHEWIVTARATVRGPASLGGLFQDEGIPSVPGPAVPGPGDDPYFRGGYNTRRHGSLSGSEVIDGIQIEHHYRGCGTPPRTGRSTRPRPPW